MATVLEGEASKVKDGSGGGGLDSIVMDPLRAYTRSYIVKENHIGYKQIDILLLLYNDMRLQNFLENIVLIYMQSIQVKPS